MEKQFTTGNASDVSISLASIVIVHDNANVMSVDSTVPSDVTCNSEQSCIFPIGASSVRFLATDASGNTQSCISNVTIIDNEPPSFINCPLEPIRLVTDPNQSFATLAAPLVITASDNSLKSVILSEQPQFQSTYEVGSHQITITASDASNNKATCNVIIDVVGLSNETY